MNNKVKNKKILVTGGAGFIGSNIVDRLLEQNNIVVCLDNFATGFRKNLESAFKNENFTLIEGDIRNLEDCKKAVKGCDYVLHQAALGSVPRSIKDPITTNEVNITGFLNMLVASRDEGIKRFIYAASSSTYGDSKELPKVEERIGKPLSPYAITKYTNELYADVFAKTYDMECIGLRYFNVFGRRQNPESAYAAVIPLWVKMFINKQSPAINGNGDYSRDFTYIENVIHANERTILTSSDKIKELTCSNNIAEVFNVAFGGNTTLNQLFSTLKGNLSKFDKTIADLEPFYREIRSGDIPHSQASIDKAKQILNYFPKYSAEQGIELTCEWYFSEMRRML